MIELRLLQYLADGGFTAYMEMPKDFRVPLVIIEKTSGDRVGPGVYTATFAVQCYEKTLYETAELAYRVRDYMEDFAAGDSICHCELNTGPYSFNHPGRKEYRYQLVYNITYYKE